MTRKEILPLHKLFMLVAFVCAALFVSLFIYHNKQNKGKLTSVAEGNGTLFAVPQAIKPFELVTGDEKKFTHKDLLNHWTLLFFGFTHCSQVCPTTLDMLQRAYAQLSPLYPNLQVVLVTLDPERDPHDKLQAYTKSFHPDFIGLTGKIQEIRKLQSQLHIFSTIDETSGEDYQLQHTSSILLFNPHGQWTALYRFGMTPETFIYAFKETMRVVG